ncbi:hypothetical protein TNCV_2148351 [Trichonephila clavipes]|uniref:C2H2-type domain-containing protein n=1 Tax=Trichonephila clavipes TaxID=2585209 RepID=A0A8X6T2T5_TRICX|nr:hypothetical protein TNCV_2148351 [Trichonephila clavipes]
MELMNIDIRGLYETSLRKNVGAQVFPFACPQCPYTSHYKSNLNRHIRKHSGERPFVCKICGKSFVQKCYLRSHEISHSLKKIYVCSVCKLSLRTLDSLKIHMLSHKD